MYLCIFLILHFVFHLNSIKSECRWLNNVNNNEANIEVYGNGIYKRYQVDFNISSFERFEECQLAYQVFLPKQTYVDIDKLDLIQSQHKTGHFSNAEIEYPAHLAEPTLFYAYPVKRLIKSFVYEDSFVLDIKLRHFAPRKSTYSPLPTITFTLPNLFMNCPKDTRISKDKSCQQFKRSIPCNSTTNVQCDFIKIPLKLHSFGINALIGSQNYSSTINFVTAFTIIFGLLFLFKSSR